MSTILPCQMCFLLQDIAATNFAAAVSQTRIGLVANKRTERWWRHLSFNITHVTIRPSSFLRIHCISQVPVHLFRSRHCRHSSLLCSSTPQAQNSCVPWPSPSNPADIQPTGLPSAFTESGTALQISYYYLFLFRFLVMLFGARCVR